MPTTSRTTAVTILARQLVNAGAERQLFLLVTHLAAVGWDVRVVSLGDEVGREHWAGPLRDAGVQVRHVAVGTVPQRVRRLRRMLKDFPSGLIHAFHAHAAPYGLLARSSRSTPVISGIRSLPEPWYLRLTLWERAALYGSTALVCNSEAALARLRSRFPRCAAPVVIPNGTVLPALGGRAATRKAGRALLGISMVAPTVGIIARLVPEKRVDVFVRAVAELCRVHAHLQAVVVGAGPEAPRLAHLARELGCERAFRFIGEYPDASSLLPALDVCCLTSDTEGVPNVLLEAASWELPAVATAVGGVPEVVRHEVTGYLVSAGDNVGLAARIDQLLCAPERRAAMGAAARRHIASRFSVGQMGRLYEKLYTQVAQRVTSRTVGRRIAALRRVRAENVTPPTYG